LATSRDQHDDSLIRPRRKLFPVPALTAGVPGWVRPRRPCAIYLSISPHPTAQTC